MKKFYFTLSLVCISLLAGAQEPFSKLYKYFLGMYGGMTVNNVIQARNGDFIVSGVVSVGNVGLTHYVLLVTDPSGDLKLMKEIDTPDWWSPSYESDVIQTRDDGFLFCGNDPYGRGGIIVKYDPDWNIIWNKVYHSEMNLVTIDRLSADSTGYIYAYGETYAYSPNSDVGSLDLLLMKLDSTGNIVEQYTAGNPINTEQSTRFLRMSSGDFVLAGHRYTPNAYNNDEILVKLNASYDAEWTKTLTTDAQTYYRIMAVKEAADGQLLVTGNLYYQYSTIPQPFIAKLNIADGTPVWIKSYQLGNNENLKFYFSGIAVDNNGYITGTGGCYDDKTTMTLIFSADDSGEIIWAKRNDSVYGGDLRSSVSGADIKTTISGGFVIAGFWTLINPPLVVDQGIHLIQATGEGLTYCTYTDLDMVAIPSPITFDDQEVYSQQGTIQVLDTTYFTDYFLVPESYDDCLSLDVRNPVSEASLSIAPNPSEGRFRITMADATAEGSLVLFNTSGKEVYRITSVSPAQLENGMEINLQVVPGIYLLEITAGKNRITRKVIVQ